MEYLPEDPNETDIKNKEKTEKRLKEFREYIVDKGIVLSFVKVLLSQHFINKYILFLLILLFFYILIFRYFFHNEMQLY